MNNAHPCDLQTCPLVPCFDSSVTATGRSASPLCITLSKHLWCSSIWCYSGVWMLKLEKRTSGVCSWCVGQKNVVFPCLITGCGTWTHNDTSGSVCGGMIFISSSWEKSKFSHLGFWCFKHSSCSRVCLLAGSFSLSYLTSRPGSKRSLIPPQLQVSCILFSTRLF